MFCKDCGSEIPAGSRFCPNCGAPAEPETEEVPVTQEAPAEAAPVEEVPAETAAAAAAVEELAAEAPAGKKKGVGKKLAIGVLCAALVGLVAAGGVFLFQKFLAGGGEAGAGRVPVYAYLTDEDELMLLPDLKEKTEALEVTDRWEEWSAEVQFSRDGKRVYFLDEDDGSDRADLYCATVSQLKKDEGADRIVKDVEYFRALDGQNVLFIRYDDQDDWGMSLGLYNGEDDEVFSSSCEDFTVSEDEKTLYYTEYKKDALTLYRVDLASGEEETLVEGVDSILTAYDAETLVYTVDETRPEDSDAVPADDIDASPEAYNPYTVYACKPGQEPEALAQEVNGYYTSAKVENGQIELEYTVQQIRDATLYDFVNDPGDADVAAMNPPDYIEYDIREVYFLPDTGEWYYVNYMDDVWHPIDVSSLLSGGAAAQDLDEWDVWNVARDALDREYQEKQEAWENARRRSELREELQNYSYTVESYDLYRYVNGAPQLVATDVTNLYGQDGVYIYQKAPGQDKVADLADLDLYDYYETLDSALQSSEWYQNINGKESPLDLGEDVNGVFDLFALSDREVVVSAYGYSEDYLLPCSLEGDQMKVGSTLGEDSVTCLRVQEVEGKKSLYFLSGFNTDSATLVRYQDGEQTELAKDVSRAWIMEDGETCYAITQAGGKDELVRIKDGQSTTVTDELATDPMLSPLVISGDNVLYISQDRRLYVWDGQESRRLAKGVEAVWANGSDVYTQIW